MRGFLLAAMMLGTLTGAQAADMPDLPFLRGSYVEGLSSTRTSWQGYYVGGQADYGSITSKTSTGINGDLQSTFIPPAGFAYNWQPLGRAHSTNGGLGLFAGYNSQWDDVVVGFEANYIHDGFGSRTSSVGLTFLPDNVTVASRTFSQAIVRPTDFGSVRIRGGYVIGCFLPYAFFGAGIGSQTIDRNVSAVPDPLRPAWTSDSRTKLVYGYSAGAGFDVMLVGGLFARAEYEYRRVTSNVESNVNSVRIGLGYKF